MTRCFCLNLIIITGYTPLLSNGKNLVKIGTDSEWMFQCFKFHYLSVMIIYHQPKYFCQWMLDGWEFTFCNFLCCHPHWSTYSQRIVWTLIRDQVSVCMHGLYIVGVRMYCVHAFCYCTKQCSPFLQNTISDFSLFCPCCKSVKFHKYSLLGFLIPHNHRQWYRPARDHFFFTLCRGCWWHAELWERWREWQVPWARGHCRSCRAQGAGAGPHVGLGATPLPTCYVL